MAVYIHQLTNWPQFTWAEEQISPMLVDARRRQDRLLGRMQSLGFGLQTEANLQTLTLDVLKSSEIEGEQLDAEQVRSSIARRLGIEIAGLVPSDRHVEGIVEMMLDATQQFSQPLSEERLFRWHAALFPTGYSGMYKVTVASWRDNTKDDPMQVVSGAAGKETVHFEAPDAERLSQEMKQFIQWFNEDSKTDPVLKAALAHLWFVTVHPFDDGNGRIARAIADLQLARADDSTKRFYSMSAQIRKERREYYYVLETTQKGSLDITTWLRWFIECFNRSLQATDETLAAVLLKARFWDKFGSTALNTRQRIMLNKLLDGFEGKLNSSKWAKISKTSSDTALRDIQDLLQKKILIKEVGGGRSTSYMLNEF